MGVSISTFAFLKSNASGSEGIYKDAEEMALEWKRVRLDIVNVRQLRLYAFLTEFQELSCIIRYSLLFTN